ncbi:alpha/beta hydrolase [Catenuloplanes sp. NPDC051500]|uniref:alpha/beta hydrolase n=1 Tax=Catenuloplanes sp. NPDC051500 TaxID=3363959 RepID=UPI0037BDEBA5
MSNTVIRVLRPVGITVAAIIAVLLVVVIALFAWPLDGDGLHPAAQRLSFAEAQARIVAAEAREQADPALRPECRSRSLIHDGKPAAASVLMLHGFTACPAQFGELAQLFFDKGYNVYVPLAPAHGFPDRSALPSLRAEELIEYASGALDVTQALGSGDTGVIGLSGGGVLATRITADRPDDVRHLLAISPFYRPAAAQAPSIIVKPFTVLFGFHLVPDHVNGANLSFYALSQYLRLAETIDTGRTGGNLASIAVVTSPNDGDIDLARAVSVPLDIADARGLNLLTHEIPADLGVGHDAVDPGDIGAAKTDLYPRYLRLYQGSAD